MARAAPGGFVYRSGPYQIRKFSCASTVTFRKGQPVTFSSATNHNIIELAGNGNDIVGIAVSQGGSQGSLGSRFSTRAEVLVPEETTVFEVICATNLGSIFTAGEVLDINKSGNYHRPVDSRNSAFVVLLPREDGTVLDSTNSTVLVSFLKSRLSAFGRNA